MVDCECPKFSEAELLTGLFSDLTSYDRSGNIDYCRRGESTLRALYPRAWSLCSIHGMRENDVASTLAVVAVMYAILVP